MSLHFTVDENIESWTAQVGAGETPRICHDGICIRMTIESMYELHAAISEALTRYYKSEAANHDKLAETNQLASTASS